MTTDIRRITTQICLVSKEPLPNYIGAVTLTRSVRRVHLVVTHKMRATAERLGKILESKNISVLMHDLERPRPKETFDLLEALVERREVDADDLAVNVTGGTKIMSLTAVEWANMHDVPPFYVDTEANELVYLTNRMRSEPIVTKLKVADILHAQGFHFGKDKPPRTGAVPKRDVLRRIVELGLDRPDVLRSVNGAIPDGNGGMYCCDCRRDDDMELFRLFEEAGMASCSEGRICFADAERMKWCKGGWLESYVHAVLYGMRADATIDDWSMDLRVFAEKRDAENCLNPSYRLSSYNNEFDAAFTACNRLYVVECKTIGFNGADNATGIAYKLDSLTSKAGGVFATGIIVSVNDLPPRDRERMRQDKRTVISGRRLPRIEAELRDLIDGNKA